MRRTTFLPFALAALAWSCSSGNGSPPAGTPPPSNTDGLTTFHEHVEPIFHAHCQNCHHDGGIAPFELVTYKTAKMHSATITQKVGRREMPPWGEAETPDCKRRLPLADDLHLADADIKTIATWHDQGALEGDPAKAPPPKTFPKVGLSGVTDTLAPPAAYTVKGNTTDDFRCFVVDPKLDADTWISGTNVVPGDPRVVHHVIVFVDPKRETASKTDASGSYPCFGGPGTTTRSLLVAWAPGVPPAEYSADAAIKVPKGSLLVMQVHYHPTDVDAPDLTKVELRRHASTPTYEARVQLIGNARSASGLIKLLPGPGDPSSGPEFVIPAGASGHTESMELVLPAVTPELKLASIGTHMHWVGKDMRIGIERAAPTESDPASECLIETPRYDFNWQRGYTYSAPVDKLPTVRAGDKLKMTCWYDNTLDNPYVARALAEQKLSSPVDVHLGETTLDEMCLGAFVFLVKN